jgi:hypothetical protein
MLFALRTQWAKKLRQALARAHPASPARAARPGVEALEAKVVPSVDVWVASGAVPVSWGNPAAWSLGAAPRAGDDVILQTDAQGLGSAPILLGSATPLLDSVTLDGSWAGTLTLQAAGQLNAHTITLEARPQLGDEILLGPGTEVHSDTALNLYGGSIGGAGVVQAEGAVTVNGTSAADAPTLGAYLEVGDGTTPTTMTFAEQSVPLVVMADGNIDVQANASVDFETMPASGSAAVAVVSADAGPHTLTLDGGTVSRADTSELLVGMGAEVNAGTLETFSPTQQGPQAGTPLHFTGFNADGQGLTVRGGAVLANADLSFDDGVNIAGGLVDVAGGATLEAGTASAPVTSTLSGGDLRLEGTFRVHGDFVMTGGTLETTGAPDGQIALDPGYSFSQSGGTVISIADDMVAGGMMVANANAAQPTPPSGIPPADSDQYFASVSAVPTQPTGGSGQVGMPPSFVPAAVPCIALDSYAPPADWMGAGLPGDTPAVS